MMTGGGGNGGADCVETFLYSLRISSTSML
jgi:hypothetical protein